MEVSVADARRLGIADGDPVEVRTPRGRVIGAAWVCGIRDGVLFVPFHYGYRDVSGDQHHRAGNELTQTDWDPVSKQPIFKTAAATASPLITPGSREGEVGAARAASLRAQTGQSPGCHG